MAQQGAACHALLRHVHGWLGCTPSIGACVRVSGRSNTFLAKAKRDDEENIGKAG
jgi:hypothetical protein